ncbi:hypothetical protein [Dyadobacter frigoris]|uniref:Uncharacterized protein n=1 Tax=Dyadobacter frigoris TaxID=2576211 RepID=A0A4V6Y205_9BACT|nr:hypothetical protein [Dyadobacter frigoris]TKT93303.1 hypothetical protein FDK13_05475 [Dyadobacter frigoris]
MEEQEKLDPIYIKGFNEGYLISQHMPEIADQLAKAYGTNARGQGFNHGKEQYLNEQFEQRLPSWMKHKQQKNDPEQNVGRNKNLDRDMDVEK